MGKCSDCKYLEKRWFNKGFVCGYYRFIKFDTMLEAAYSSCPKFIVKRSNDLEGKKAEVGFKFEKPPKPSPIK